MTPFMPIYRYHPPSMTSSVRESYKVQAVEDHMKHQQKASNLRGQHESSTKLNETTSKSTP